MGKIVCGAVGAAALGMTSASSALTVDYSFTNTVGNVPGTVTGQIVGLTDNAASAATAIYVDSYPAVLAGSSGLGAYPTPFDVLTWSGTVVENSFTVSDGVVTQALFEITAANGDEDQLFLNSDCNCVYGTGHTNYLDIGTNNNLDVFNVGNLNAPDGLILGSGVPEPATWALMLIGFGGLGATLRGTRRQRATA